MTSAGEKLILITNDDGLEAKGIFSLAEAMGSLGRVIIVAPIEPQSGMSQAITVKHPLRIVKAALNGTERFAINGTPADCVKLALNQLLPRKPDLLVSGINHGSNSSTSVLYSGTLGAALEGCINSIPSIGFSLMSWNLDADFEAAKVYANKIALKVIENGLPDFTCLNVNIPAVPANEIKGFKVCRQTIGYWKEEFEKRTDPGGNDYFWLTGKYHNTEPEDQDTDEWALKNNYIAIVPIRIDLTSYSAIDIIKNWNL